jgi:multidrug efflux system outer membrane protein
MKTSFTTHISLFIVGLLIYSCAVGPNYHKPKDITAAEFRLKNKDSIFNNRFVNLKWWEIFQDSVVDTLVRLALANNKNLLIAASRVNQARANVKFTNSDRLPKYGYRGSAGGTNMLLGNTTDQFNSFSGTVNASWEIDFWGKYKRATEAAKANLLSSFYGKRAIEITLISEIAINYFKLIGFRTQLDISKKTLASRDSTLTIIQHRFDYGYTHIIDVNQAEIQKAISQTAVPYYRRMIEMTENNLSVLIGKSPDQIKTNTTYHAYKLPDSIPIGIPSEVLLRRPDVLQAEQNFRSSNAKIGVAQAMRYPSFSLTGLLGVGSSELSNILGNGLGWGATAGITGPIFEFGKNKRRVDIAREVAKQSLLSYENTVLNSMREVSNALVEIETLKEELKARQLRLDAAKNASSLSSQRYYQGVTSYLEVIENQRQEFDAELSFSDNFQQLLTAHVRLYKSLGGGWISEDELEKQAALVAKEQGVELDLIDRDTLIYSGQIVDFKLTNEEEKKRKLEREKEKEEYNKSEKEEKNK